MIHKFCEFYKKIYLLSSKIPKKDRFGIWLKIENICLNIFDFLINASLELKINKPPILNSIRIKTETIKRLIRIAYELDIISRKTYIELESNLQESSKMINGWIKYLSKKSQ
ncbi:four helix bundle protein [Patescibacteria group bacterium]|nr:four helix bundle protein [Patescibacteria group bacterium]MBU3922674.1 four helix bundle protein [Patescibacteria group bacterium]